MPNADPQRRKPVRRAPLPTLILHWMTFVALTVSLTTGLRIAADASHAPVAKSLSAALPQGDVLFWHLGSGALLTALVLAYGIYQWLSGQWRRFLPRARESCCSCRKTLGFLSFLPRARESSVRTRGWQWLDLRLSWLLFVLMPLALFTGLLQYPGSAPVPALLLEAVHRAMAWGLAGYALLHVMTHLAAGGPRRLLGMFLPRRRWVAAGAVAGTTAVAALAALPVMDRNLLAELDAVHTDAPPTLDGRPNDAVWAKAQPVELRLANGANLPGGQSRVQLRAAHDGERVYLLCEWTDPTRSQKHVPMLKTADGWRIAQTAYRDADENRFYEDKLALMLARGDSWAALRSIHLGPRPLAGQPGAPGGRGLHYTVDGSVLDVWHWKSVRNAAERQADDNFFGPPLPAPAETSRRRDPDSGAWLPRYTAGYRKDPPGTYSGYEMNWENFAEGVTLPLRLPDDPRDVAHLQGANLDAARSDGGDWWIEFNDTRPYADGPDLLPVGTILPSVLPTGRLTGDRGDIQARGTWHEGRWRLELSRLLDTGSDKDVPVADGTLLWVAVFDHSQTRHAYHLRPVRIRLGDYRASHNGNLVLSRR
jgi:thiosulfate reductase cytochrome b subunit